MSSWKFQDAKARFSEFFNAAMTHGPQTITMRGIEVAVLVSMEEWRGIQSIPQPYLKDLLLSCEPRFDNCLPSRRKLKRRKPAKFW